MAHLRRERLQGAPLLLRWMANPEKSADRSATCETGDWYRLIVAAFVLRLLVVAMIAWLVIWILVEVPTTR